MISATPKTIGAVELSCVVAHELSSWGQPAGWCACGVASVVDGAELQRPRAAWDAKLEPPASNGDTAMDGPDGSDALAALVSVEGVVRHCLAGHTRHPPHDDVDAGASREDVADPPCPCSRADPGHADTADHPRCPRAVRRRRTAQHTAVDPEPDGQQRVAGRPIHTQRGHRRRTWDRAHQPSIAARAEELHTRRRDLRGEQPAVAQHGKPGRGRDTERTDPCRTAPEWIRVVDAGAADALHELAGATELDHPLRVNDPSIPVRSDRRPPELSPRPPQIVAGQRESLRAEPEPLKARAVRDQHAPTRVKPDRLDVLQRTGVNCEAPHQTPIHAEAIDGIAAERRREHRPIRIDVREDMPILIGRRQRPHPDHRPTPVKRRQPTAARHQHSPRPIGSYRANRQ
jgi:hypothetical protein